MILQITIVDAYKKIVVTPIGLVLSDRVLHDCMSVIIDGHITIAIACHEIKAVCVLN